MAAFQLVVVWRMFSERLRFSVLALLMPCTTKLKNALGIEAVSAPAFMDTIHSMHPIVKSMLDDVCETAKQEMKDIKEDELGCGNVP